MDSLQAIIENNLKQQLLESKKKLDNEVKLMKKSLKDMNTAYISVSTKSPYQKTLHRVSIGVIAAVKLNEVIKDFENNVINTHAIHQILIEFDKFFSSLLNEHKQNYTEKYSNFRKKCYEFKSLKQ